MDMLKAGTGEMQSLSQSINDFQKKGYIANFVPCYDHFAVNSGKQVLYPNDFVVDEIVRFENSSDPDDQSILYAISVPTEGTKGLYVDSFGIYHDELSKPMIDRIQNSWHTNPKS